MEGMQNAGVLANAKHFPGHGDTDQDSHKTLPTVSFNKKRIDSIELYPYRKLIKEGLSSVMVAHLNIPSLESRPGHPSSLSKHIVTDILKDSLVFQGLIFTDSLTMKGAADFSETGEIDLELTPIDIPSETIVLNIKTDDIENISQDLTTPYVDRVTSLIVAMAQGKNLRAYSTVYEKIKLGKIKTIEVERVAKYQGREFNGEIVVLKNTGKKIVYMEEKEFIENHVKIVGLSISKLALKPGDKCKLYLVSKL